MISYFYLLLMQFTVLIPSALYFFAPSYSDGQPGIKKYLRGSAVCTRTQDISFFDRASGQNVTRTQVCMHAAGVVCVSLAADCAPFVYVARRRCAKSHACKAR